MKRIVVAVGTRPEVIKIYPLMQALSEESDFEGFLINTGQHRELVDSAFKELGFVADIDLAVMEQNQTPSQVLARIVPKITDSFQALKPDLVLVHGDTTSSLASAVAAHYMGIPVGHIEAGLRSGKLNAPWPEEANRRMVDSISDFHFAPTSLSLKNLQAEGRTSSSYLTGNTVIDSLRLSLNLLRNGKGQEIYSFFQKIGVNLAEKYVLVTQHRRENFGQPIESVFTSINEITGYGYNVLVSAHPNKQVQDSINKLLSANQSVTVLNPQPYYHFIELMRNASLIITDSGGVQEEAPSLGTPVLVTRQVTERPEGVIAGVAKLVGTSRKDITQHSIELLANQTKENKEYELNPSPYGNGFASNKIIDILLEKM